MKTNYQYQQTATNEIMKQMLSNRYIASVLAACPGSGKTTISQMVINAYIAKFPMAKVVVLTEGQKTLKNQYLEELNTAHIKINFSYGDFSTGAQVQVGLPQSIGQLQGGFDLLVIDEAQNFYFAPMVQEIIKKYNPKHTLLMTGSPTKFNEHNSTQRTQYGMHYISAEQLQAMGVFSSVVMDVVRVTNKKDAKTTVAAALYQAKQRGDNLSKIMVACPSIDYALQTAIILEQSGYTVAVSTSETDKDDSQIASFKSGQANALVVVDKGVLGFNDSKITALFDFKSSSNLDSSYQLFARVLRKHPQGVKKSYYRVSDSDFNKQVLELHKMRSLMQTDIFKGFTGKNLKLQIG